MIARVAPEAAAGSPHGRADRAALRIVHVNASDRGGGAERVASDLCRAMREAGHEAWLAVGRRLGPDEPHVLALADAASGWRRFWARRAERARHAGAARLYRGLGAPRGMLARLVGREDFDHPASRRLASLLDPAPDVFHLHNLHGGYFDLRLLPVLSRRGAVFVTLHDPWMITGHCAHPFGCPRWETGCGSCPDLTIYPAVRRDATAFNWRRKGEIYARSRLHLAAPSRWLLAMVERSMLLPGARGARVIPNGIDLEIFGPGDRRQARAGLGLPADQPIVLFVAGGLSQARFRDFDTLGAALEGLGGRLERPACIVALGQPPAAAAAVRTPIRFVSHRSDPREVAAFYRAADLFVHATRADTFPSVVLEAGACGIATVASAVGGITEQIEAGHTGELVPPGDPDRLGQAIAALLRDDARRLALGQAAARRVAERYDLRRIARDYLAWYAEALDALDRNGRAGEAHPAARRPPYSRASER